MLRYLKYTSPPPFVVFITHNLKICVDNQIVFPEVDQMYCLCGIIYINSSHFVCRFIDKSGGVWYHDGAEYKEHVLYYNNIINFPYQKLQTVDKKYQMTLVVYTRL